MNSVGRCMCGILSGVHSNEMNCKVSSGVTISEKHGTHCKSQTHLTTICFMNSCPQGTGAPKRRVKMDLTIPKYYCTVLQWYIRQIRLSIHSSKETHREERELAEVIFQPRIGRMFQENQVENIILGPLNLCQIPLDSQLAILTKHRLIS